MLSLIIFIVVRLLFVFLNVPVASFAYFAFIWPFRSFAWRCIVWVVNRLSTLIESSLWHCCMADNWFTFLIDLDLRRYFCFRLLVNYIFAFFFFSMFRYLWILLFLLFRVWQLFWSMELFASDLKPWFLCILKDLFYCFSFCYPGLLWKFLWCL